MSIELLAPAGDMERLRMAVAYGADAVYLAGSDFGGPLRATLTRRAFGRRWSCATAGGCGSM